MPDYENLRAVDTRWTPLTDEVRDLVEQLKREAGSWRSVSRATGIPVRYIRRIRQREATESCKPLKAISLRTLDTLLTPSEMAHRVQLLPWYTVEEMQEMGIWELPLPHVVRKGG